MSECPYCGRKDNRDSLHEGRRGPFKSAHGSKIFGVCAGIADHFGWSRFVVRLVTLLGLVFFFPAVLIAYFLAALLLDSEPSEPHYPV